MITFHPYDFYPFNNTHVTNKFLMLCVSILKYSKMKKYILSYIYIHLKKTLY